MRNLLIVGAAILGVGGVAMAQTIPPELQNQPKDLEWIWMGATGAATGTCPAGHFIGAHKYTPAHCMVSINECLSLHRVPAKNWSGSWICDVARVAVTK